MWLISTSTLELESFYGSKIPRYAILSHTWGDAEVSFQEFRQVTEIKRDKITSRAGYRKIIAACNKAQNDGHSYVWVDTCCIDKTSSAELTEAINSMFGWYRQSQVCYAYLGDCILNAADISSHQEQFDAEFRRCRWFTRGWCLQELLAPRQLRFLNEKWEEIGTRGLYSQLISEITGIPEMVLRVPPKKNIHDFPIAARISWIGRRQTTRIEDLSYGLLGILNVTMPMLYGEGETAFLRLQEELIKKYNELSIFAWSGWNGPVTASGFMPILAARPSLFAINSTNTTYHRNTGSQLGDRLSTQFSLTNQGIFFPKAKLQYQPAVAGYRHQYILPLHYHDPSFHGIGGRQRYILLQKVGPGLFARLHEFPERLKAFQKSVRTSIFSEPVCILNNLPLPVTPLQLVRWERNAVRLRWKRWEKFGKRYWQIRAAEPQACWDIAAMQFLLELSHERHMHIEFVPGNYESNPGFKYFVLLIQVDEERRRGPAKVSARMVSTGVWEGTNVATFGFRNREPLALEVLQSMNDKGDRLSLVGYDISVSVQLVSEPNEQPYNLVYLDWEETKSLPDTNETS